ncbi:MAG TPA: ribose-5-phosphate isomerase RpiA [Ktedonobacterales bacterium]|nr:ribose-5-phosphate isomerase RpiA [Ktedonobacterales bacterium]
MDVVSGGPAPRQQDEWKRAAAGAAVVEASDRMTVGLGTGSTAELFIRALAERVWQGLRITGVATSERTAALARDLRIPLAALDDVDHLDISFDGADEVTLPSLDLLKGHGGALLREKLVALASRRRIILADETKVVGALAVRKAIPVEVEMFGWRHTARRLAALGCAVARRSLDGARANDPTAEPFITDGGHYTLMLTFAAAPEPAALAARLKATAGVVDHGLFVGMTERVYIGGPTGVRVVDRA